VKPRQFLSTDSEDGIEAILIECQGYSLHKYISRDGPLRPIIDFDLSREKFDKIELKLLSKEIQDLLCHAFSRTCKEIYSEWDSHTLTIASSSDKKKISLYISTFGLHLKNIAKVAIFTELIRKKLPHMRIKKAIFPKDSSVFDFMLCLPNDESPEVVSPLLVISEPASTKIFNTCTETTEDIKIELNLIAKLLEEFEIRGYELSSPCENFPNSFLLKQVTPAFCSLCYREYGYKDPHTSDNAHVIQNKKSYSFYCHHANNNREAGSRKPSIKLTIKEKTSEQEESLAVLEKLNQPRITDPNNHFVWGDLIDIYSSGEKYTHSKVYEAIQATIAYINREKKFWIFKVEDEDENSRLTFEFVPKLELANYEVNIVEFGGGIDKVKVINRSSTKPALKIKKEIIDPILWHIKNKPHSICVLKSTLQQCGKNIIINFIGNKVLGPKLYYATSDLGKILGKFNSLIQGKKLVVINETNMSSGEWYKFNGHLKSLITEPKVSIERKGLEPIHLKDYLAFIVTSNQDASLKIDAGDAHIVCFDISACYRGNILYFKLLAKILEHPDVPGIVMSYLLNRDLSNWDPQDIPSTKMKTDTILEHLSSSTRFIINPNGEKLFSNNILDKKFTYINIENKRAGSEKREWQYIFDRSKIVAKLCKLIEVIKEFSNVSQPETLANKFTDIPMFYVPEIKLSELEKNIAETSTTDHIEKGKDSSPAPIPAVTNMIQDLFNYITGQSEYSVASSFKTTDIFMTPEIEYIEPVDNKSESSSKIIEELEIRGYALSKACLRKTAIKYGEDPDKFMTITEENRDLEYIELSRQEKLICMEIKLRMYEDDSESRSYTCIYD
ncbi:9399_t:CDS:2, partial [Scutellospora calospora]